MARFLPEKEIIESNIEQQMENSYTKYSTMLQGTPIFAVLYHKDITDSDADRILEDVKEVVGNQSPVKYNKIVDFPLFLSNEMSPNIEFDESFGINSSTEGEGVFVPSTIRPYIDDFLYMELYQKKYLFRITNIEYDKINGKKYYKVQFKLSHYLVEDIEQQLSDEYQTHYENIGTEDNAIIKKSDSELITKMEDVIVKLIDFYELCFMDDKYNVFVYQYNDKILYNEFLIRFLINNNILETPRKRLLKTTYVQDIFRDNAVFMDVYKYTIYGLFANRKKEMFTLENFTTYEIQKNLKNNPFSLDSREFYRTMYVNADYSKFHKELEEDMDRSYQDYKDKHIATLNYGDYPFGKQSSLEWKFLHSEEEEPKNKKRHVLICPHKSKLVEYLNSGILFEDNVDNFLENIIIMYFNNKLEIDENFLVELRNFNFHPTFKEFLLIPCVIFILKEKIKELSN